MRVPPLRGVFSIIYTIPSSIQSKKERYFLKIQITTSFIQFFNRDPIMSSKLSESSSTVTSTTGLLEFELLGAKEFPHVDQPKELSTSCDGPGTFRFFYFLSFKPHSIIIYESIIPILYDDSYMAFILTYIHHNGVLLTHITHI